MRGSAPQGSPVKDQDQQLPQSRAEQKERKKEGKKNPAETSKDDVKSQGEGATKGRNTAPSPAAVKM